MPATNSAATRPTRITTGLRRFLTSAVDPDQDAADEDQPGAHEQAAADELGLAQEQRREPDAEERLGGDERRDDGHASTVVRLEQADVREAEADPGGREDAQRAAARQPPRV